jgi:hypothetical protein
VSLQDVTLPDAAIVARLNDLAVAARDLADLVGTRDHLQQAGMWLQQVILGATQAHEVAQNNAQEPEVEVIHRARMLGHYIWTHSGQQFFPQDPRADEVKLEDIAWALAHKYRWTGHADITVAEHSLLVAHLASALAAAEEVDHTEAFLYGLLHDAHEAYLPDVARPVAQYLGTELMRMAAGVQAAILEALSVPPPSPVIDGIVRDADDYALRLEAEECFSQCDPVEARVGREPPAWLRGDHGPLAQMPAADKWLEEVQATLAKLRETKPEDLALDSWKDQGAVVETQERCAICLVDDISRPAVASGLCQECLDG